MLDEKPEDCLEILDMPQMAQFVYDFYQAKLSCWNKLQSVTREAREKKSEQEKTEESEERLERLNEEERILREKLGRFCQNCQGELECTYLNFFVFNKKVRR